MLFNGWFMVSIISGAAIGYFIFGHSFTKVNCENYKIIRQSYCIYACPEAGKVTNVLLIILPIISFFPCKNP